MPRSDEPWGGEVKMPRWARRLLHRRPPPQDSPERAHERHQPEAGGPSVLENADRASVGALSQLYEEGRRKRPLR